MESFQPLPTTLPSSSPSPTSSGNVIVSSPCIASSAPTPRRKKKKRSKTTTTTIMIKVDDPGGTGVGSSAKVRTATGKPDPNAPKITRPCTECGKRFWSWKALFGHMRCHPERQWRGINPPPNARSSAMRLPGALETEPFRLVRAVMTEEDHEVVECLLKLADSPVITVNRGAVIVQCAGPMTCQKFKCSSCKKVFGSHQALGGHRASHKNVKGCFAMTRGGDRRDEAFIGSHGRCHWEKGGDEEEEEEEEGQGQLLCLDLNRPAPTADEDSTLDLRLCL